MQPLQLLCLPVIHFSRLSEDHIPQKILVRFSVVRFSDPNVMSRISIIVPCHRVIGENGEMTGYGGGIWRKQWLLHLEKGIG